MQDRDLYESLDATFHSLGEEPRNIVIATLESHGIAFRPNNIDPWAVDQVLFDLFGMGSEALIVSTYSRLCKKMTIGFDDSEMTSAVEKIRKWLEVTEKTPQL